MNLQLLIGCRLHHRRVPRHQRRRLNDVIHVVRQRGCFPSARVRVTVTRAGVIMQLARKRDALIPPNPEELLNRPQ